MLGAVASPVDPPHGRRRRHLGERMKHGKDRRRAHASAEQHDRALAGKECETPSRPAHVQQVANPNLTVQEGAACAVRLELHADAVASLSLRTG